MPRKWRIGVLKVLGNKEVRPTEWMVNEEKSYNCRKGKQKRTMAKLIDEVSRYDVLLARTALEIKLVTKEQLAIAFSFQKRQGRQGRQITIGDALLEKKIISVDEMDGLYETIKKRLDKKFGFYALKKGLATRDEVDRALAEQAKELKATQSCRLTGDILVDHGVITEEERDRIRLEMKGMGHPANGLKSKVLPDKRIPDSGRFQIVISKDGLKACIKVSKTLSHPITPEDVLNALHRHTVQYGIFERDEIARILEADSLENQSFVVATGKPSFPGRDASIDYLFDTQFLKAGTIDEDGNIDYRARGTAPRVLKGDLLARKTPLQDSRPGIDVFGKLIPAPEVNDIELVCGEGAALSEDGLQAVAVLDGQPEISGDGGVCVHAELAIKGNVDFNTGNIDFDGNVHVHGTIMDGFVVKCANLQAKEIVNGQVFAEGDVTVGGGIINADIKAQGNVSAKFITDSNIKSFGDVSVDKEVIHSKIRSSGKFVAERGKIISSFVSAKMGFTAKEVGTEVSLPCRIHVGLDENVKKRIQAFDYIINDKKKILERVQRRYEQFKARGKTDPRMDEDLKTIESIIREIETISDEKVSIINWSNQEKGSPVIRVSGSIQSDTKMFGVHSSMTNKETIRNVTIREIKLTDNNLWTMVVLEPE